MKVLLFGSGAREAALAKKIKDSKLLEELYFAQTGAFCDKNRVIKFCDFCDLAKKAKKLNIDLLVVGPEMPLAQGICDIFKEAGINTIGANKYWAQLESSKSFAKSFMEKFDIKTAPYKLVEYPGQINDALCAFLGEDCRFFSCAARSGACLKPENLPVIKADGLAMGKGVFLPSSVEEARLFALEALGGKFGNASKKILFEKRLFGRELSVFSLWDGKKLLSFDPAGDFKKLKDNNEGENTGGMGACFPCILNAREKKLVDNYLKKLEGALLSAKADFCGVIYSGLMLCADEIYVLEYNMRFGDPEIQCILEVFENDILDVFEKMTQGRLCDVRLKFKNEPSFCVVLASEGYPAKYECGYEISNLECAKKYGVSVFFAGVKKEYGKYYTNGGRVLSLVKSGDGALISIYFAARDIEYKGKIYRHDINLR